MRNTIATILTGASGIGAAEVATQVLTNDPTN